MSGENDAVADVFSLAGSHDFADRMTLSRSIGQHLAASVLAGIDRHDEEFLIVSEASETDGVARGVFDSFVSAELIPKIGCFWISHTPININGHERTLAQVEQEFTERMPGTPTQIIYVSNAVIDGLDLGACVHRALIDVKATALHIVAPIIFSGWHREARLPRALTDIHEHSLFRGPGLTYKTLTLNEDQIAGLKNDGQPSALPDLALQRMKEIASLNAKPELGQSSGFSPV